MLELSLNARAIKRTKADPDSLASDRIDVTHKRGKAEFVGLANSCAASHEGIKNGSRQIMTLVKLAFEIRSVWKKRRKKDSSKRRTEPLGPPFVKVINRT